MYFVNVVFLEEFKYFGEVMFFFRKLLKFFLNEFVLVSNEEYSVSVWEMVWIGLFFFLLNILGESFGMIGGGFMLVRLLLLLRVGELILLVEFFW